MFVSMTVFLNVHHNCIHDLRPTAVERACESSFISISITMQKFVSTGLNKSTEHMSQPCQNNLENWQKRFFVDQDPKGQPFLAVED